MFEIYIRSYKIYFRRLFLEGGKDNEGSIRYAEPCPSENPVSANTAN